MHCWTVEIQQVELLFFDFMVVAEIQVSKASQFFWGTVNLVGNLVYGFVNVLHQQLPVFHGTVLDAKYFYLLLMCLQVLSPLYVMTILLFLSGIPTLEQPWNQKYGKDESFRQYRNSVPPFILFIPALYARFPKGKTGEKEFELSFLKMGFFSGQTAVLL